MVIELVHLGDSDPLGMVDAGVAAEVIGGETGDRVIERVFGAEELGAHDGARYRGIGGAGEDGDKAQTRQQVYGCAGDRGDGIAEGGAYEEERRDLSAFETGAQGNGGEEQFPEPTEGGGAARLETG